MNYQTIDTVERERERESYNLLNRKNILVIRKRLYIIYKKLRIDIINNA